MDSDVPVLIAAASGRALAASARRGGFAPLVADFFGDLDTLAVADAHVRIAPDAGMAPEALLAAFETLARSRAPAAAVCGTGFEDRPELLGRIAARWPLMGNGPQVVSRIKDPLAFADLCARCDVPHPHTTRAQPASLAGWLVKRIGGAGGLHIRADDAETPGDAVGDGFYFQRRVGGDAVSALLLADGRCALILGFSTQWTAPAPGRPFRYGGAARPAPLARQTADAMTAALSRIVAEAALVGLNSADFVLDGDKFHLVEINPRPGATLDIFEPRGASLFALHVAACRGRLPDAAPTYEGAAANAIVYADRPIAPVPALAWPAWTADRPAAGSAIAAAAPLCTVFATAATAGAARDLVACRAAAIRAIVEATLP
jgi:predicted ATP-grasp superfamily ATP-dependent carboligase